MAQKQVQLLSTKSTNGKRTYYAYVDAFGIVKPTDSEEMATVEDFKNHPHPGTRTHPEFKGRTANWIKRGGIVSITYRTDAELAASRKTKSADRKAQIQTIVDRTTKKNLEHPSREFRAKFYELHKPSEGAVAAKAKRKAKLELRAKALLDAANKL